MRRPRAGLALVWNGAASAFIVLGIAFLSPEPHGTTPDETGSIERPSAAAVAVPAAVWETFSASAMPPSPPQPPLYLLADPAWKGLSVERGTRRNTATGAREDAIGAGAFASPGAHFQLNATREPGPAPSRDSLFLASARRAAAAGLAVSRASAPVPLATKFGWMEVADAVLSSGAAERACTVFRFAHPEVGLRLDGWLCGADGGLPDRAQLICALDGLVLAPSADDPALKAAFAAAERGRFAGCRPPDYAAAAAPRGDRLDRK